MTTVERRRGTLSHEGIFERHLDLRPLRGRGRGVVRCIFHPDSTPSLSVDLDRQVFNCFGCGARGGFKRFAELVGEAAPTRRHVYLGPLDEARRDVLARERADEARRDLLRPRMAEGDRFRETMRAVDAARAIATVAGPGHLQVWELLELAATAERHALADLAEVTE